PISRTAQLCLTLVCPSLVCLSLAAASPAAAQPFVGPQEPAATPGAADEFTPHGIHLLGPKPTPEVSLEINSKTGAYKMGDLLRMRVRVERPSYVYVFYHQADRQAVLLFPNVDRRVNRLGSKTTITVPAASDTVQCMIGPPYGREAVQVIASPVRIAEFEKAFASAGDRVVCMPTKLVDQVCQKHAETSGLVADHVKVTTSAGGK
ncbi:MAG: DUF4384 domain-containing protein, partial [Planctomycetota bacterium]